MRVAKICKLALICGLLTFSVEILSAQAAASELERSDTTVLEREGIRGLGHVIRNLATAEPREMLVLLESALSSEAHVGELRSFVADSMQSEAPAAGGVELRIVSRRLDRRTDSTAVVHFLLRMPKGGKCSERAYSVLVVRRDGVWAPNVTMPRPTTKCPSEF